MRINDQHQQQQRRTTPQDSPHPSHGVGWYLDWDAGLLGAGGMVGGMNDWISVEDALPEESQPVLLFILYQSMMGGVFSEDEIIISGGRQDGDWYAGHQHLIWDYSFNLGFCADDVTHWKPLEPPK